MGEISFAVSDVSRGGAAAALDVDASLRSLLAKPVEALHCDVQRLVSCNTQHPLAKAAHDAFYDHHPLVIRPDDIWFCIAQGFALHVNANVEQLRERFVAHQGQLKLTVARPDFVLGQDNPWPEAFEAFSDQIAGHVGKLRELVCARFSTSTPTEVAAFDVALMDGFQGYFEYQMMCGCGIPGITLRGTPEDWASMLPRVQMLAEFGLETWVEALLPVLGKLVETAKGKVDVEFWRSFFRYQSGSGPAELTGWILTLFPYVGYKSLAPSPFLKDWNERYQRAVTRESRRVREPQGPGLGALPSGLVSAPVHLEDRLKGQEYDMRFVAGMFGVNQDPKTLALSPSFGWAVVYESEPETHAGEPEAHAGEPEAHAGEPEAAEASPQTPKSKPRSFLSKLHNWFGKRDS